MRSFCRLPASVRHALRSSTPDSSALSKAMDRARDAPRISPTWMLHSCGRYSVRPCFENDSSGLCRSRLSSEMLAPSTREVRSYPLESNSAFEYASPVAWPRSKRTRRRSLSINPASTSPGQDLQLRPYECSAQHQQATVQGRESPVNARPVPFRPSCTMHLDRVLHVMASPNGTPL